jgi:hypothetical protein
VKSPHKLLRIVPAVVLTCGMLTAPAEAQFAQQGPKLVGTGAIGPASQGTSVSLSGDGNTAIVGGPFDTFFEIGAAWVFTRSFGGWSQQAKLPVVISEVPREGNSVSLSGDGNTAIIGAPGFEY